MTSIVLVAGIAGAVHDKFDVFGSVGLLELGAEEHAEGAEAVDGGGFDRLHRGPFCGGKRPLAANDLWGGLLRLCRYFDFIHTRL